MTEQEKDETREIIGSSLVRLIHYVAQGHRTLAHGEVDDLVDQMRLLVDDEYGGPTTYMEPNIELAGMVIAAAKKAKGEATE